jgi:hexosaminidase
MLLRFVRVVLLTAVAVLPAPFAAADGSPNPAAERAPNLRHGWSNSSGVSTYDVPAPMIVPALQQWAPEGGQLRVDDGSIVVDSRYQKELASAAAALVEGLRRLHVPAAVRDQAANASDKPGQIQLTLTPNQQAATAAHGPEAYRLEIHERVIIKGNSAAGAFYGVQTLLQMLAQSHTLPKGVATDWPDYPHRMLMLDVGRKPFPMPVLRDYLRILAWYKMNELHLHLSDEAFGGSYTGFRVQCDTYPGLASKDLFYTKKELRELQDEAHRYGITITPEIDMPGHSRVFTNYWPDLRLAHSSPSYLDVTNPQTIERLKKLLDEMIPIFDAPDFHIGTDEYRVGGTAEEKARLHEAFRQFINTMNAHIRLHDKNCRIWSGFEHMGGKAVKIDPSVIVDMWDPYNPEHDGHRVINASQFVTYYVPGAHYYGVNPGGIYDHWEAWRQGCPTAPKKGDPRLLGGKLHVWNDQGPTGYTHNEIARLVLPGLQAIAEKLWGTKGSKDYAGFQKRAALTVPVPGVTIFDRMPAAKNEIVFQCKDERTLAGTDSVVPLASGRADLGKRGQSPFAGTARRVLGTNGDCPLFPRADLEWPWTLSMEICPTKKTGKRGVILSSDLAEICAEYRVKDKNGERAGIGVVRAAGAPGADPASSFLAHDVSRIYGPSPVVDKWTAITLVGERGRTTLYINGEQAGVQGEQTVCPLAYLGSKTGNSFVGRVRHLQVLSRALSAKEVGRLAGLDVPVNLAAGKRATASASDTPYGFTPEKLTDDDVGTRWSSGVTSAEQWVAIDLGRRQTFNTLEITWENAFAKRYRIETSDDGAAWKAAASGEGRQGKTTVRFAPVTARHVRIVMSHPGTGWGYSIWEVEVFKRAER